MKHSIIFTLLIALFSFTSCDLGNEPNDWGTYPESAAYLTINQIDNIDDSEAKEIYFTLDNGAKIYLADNKLEEDYNFIDGKRILGYFTIIEDYSKEENKELAGAQYGCEYGMRLFTLTPVYKAQSLVSSIGGSLTDKYTNDAIAYLQEGFGFYYDYINMHIGVSTANINDVKFTAVGNEYASKTEIEEGYFTITLYYDNAAEEDDKLTVNNICLSVDVSPFRKQLEGMKGVNLIVESSKGAVKIPIKDLTPAKE